MTDNYLLVPMQLDAMVLNKEAQITMSFNRTQTQYSRLQLFQDPEPPFPNTSSTPPAPGIYLHWTMPKALRQGSYNDDGTTNFHFAPNRWLVVRFWAGASAVEAVKAWVVESDFLDDYNGGSNPFIDPSGLNQHGTPNLKTIGRALRFDSSLKSLPDQPAPFLKSVGPGSATFASFSPNVQNVFAFTDTVTQSDDRTRIQQASFTYYVVGWYSDASIDPLAKTNWKAGANPAGTFANDTLDWFVYANSDNIAKQTMVHALVSNISWNLNADSPIPKNYPTDIKKNVKVAIGNTAIDALSAMVGLYATQDQSQAAVQADLLEAFQYGLLDRFDQPGSSEALNMAIRQHWYGASSGGTLWQIVAQERQDNTALPAPPAPIITPQQAALLATLNAQQAELDRQQRILTSMQWNLYALWWKNKWQNQISPPLSGSLQDWFSTQLPLQVTTGTCNSTGGTDPSKESWYHCKVQAQQNLVTLLTSEAKLSQSQLQALVDANTQVLKTINMPQYYYPNDPVLLVTGLGRATNFDPQGDLMCRLPSQTVDKLTVNSTTYCTDGSCGNKVSIPALSDPNGLLPDGVQRLHTESFFLSPALFAQDILGSATQGNIQAVQSGIAALPAPAAGGKFAPSVFAREEWEQPWVPLLLDWKVSVMQEPSYTSIPNQRTCNFNQGNWQFDGTDFKWVGPLKATGKNFIEPTQMVFEGRTFITPYIALTLADQLDEFVRQHKLRDPNLEKLLEDLDQFIDGIKQQDILSQRLGGLRDMMVGRNLVQTVVPSGNIAALLGDQIRGVPNPYRDEIWLGKGPAWNFGPMSGTFFVIEALTVTDTFGRTISLLLANNSSCPETNDTSAEYYFYPITGRNLKSPTGLQPPQSKKSNDPAERMIQLLPSTVQDSQLSFRLTSNDGKDSDIDHVAGANPVCGWIVPNHLDRSLTLYAPDGAIWGECYLSQHSKNKFVPIWQPDPTNPNAPQSVAAIPNPYVKAMLETLINRADDGLGFSDFLRVIDETLWSINPQGQRKDQNLSVLIGRPLAIVRARASLKLRGLPFYNQDWWNTFDIPQSPPPADQPAELQTVDGGVCANLWPVRLGNNALRSDGLIGYYLDNPAAPDKTFQVFNTVNLPADTQADYLNKIGGNNYLKLRFIDDTVTTPDPAQNQACDLTMLVDPRGSVHAFTGLLPVTQLAIPSGYVTPALKNMYYTFRAGPFLTLPDAVRIPRPAEVKGNWNWFDKTFNTTAPISQADQKVRIATTPPVIKEGWLKFTPNPPQDDNKD